MPTWSIMRNLMRILMLLLIMSPAFGLTLFYGNFSSALFLGKLHLTDPLAALQVLLANPAGISGRLVYSALIIFALYALLGRVFCGWVCPLGAIQEWVGKLPIMQKAVTGNGSFKYHLLLVVLVVSYMGSIPLFEIFSPMSLLNRMLMFGLGVELTLILFIIMLDIHKGKGFWCHQVCPLGAFYSLIGRWRLVRLKINKQSCTNCGTCWSKCPVGEEVLRPAVNKGSTLLVHADCTNCGDCIDGCPKKALSFGLGVGGQGLPVGVGKEIFIKGS